MPDRMIRGSTLNAYYKFVKKKWGGDGLKECEDLTGIDHTSLKDGKWYPLENSLKILDWINEVKGEEYIIQCGKHTVMNLGLISYVVQFANMGTILKRAPASYKDAFNFGSLNAEISKDHAIVHIKDNCQNKLSCLGWEGAFLGMLDLTKTKGKVQETSCQLKGGDSCTFRIDWE